MAKEIKYYFQTVTSSMENVNQRRLVVKGYLNVKPKQVLTLYMQLTRMFLM